MSSTRASLARAHLSRSAVPAVPGPERVTAESRRAASPMRSEQLGHRLVGADSATASSSSVLQLFRDRRRWTPAQREQSARFWAKRQARDARNAAAMAAQQALPVAPIVPVAPVALAAPVAAAAQLNGNSNHLPAHDGYRQYWGHPTTAGHSYNISSGHGYRAQHKVGGPDITQLAPRNTIETAIVDHMAQHVQAGTVAVGAKGEHRVPVAGQNVGYRFKRINANTTGIGTYFL